MKLFSNHAHILRWRRGLCLLAAATALASGCSRSPHEVENKKPVHPVRGKVLVKGQPAVGAFVLFTPVNEPPENPDPRPRAEVTADGAITIFTYDSGDGAPVGEYIVTVNWPGGVRPDGSEEPRDKLLGRYSDPARSKLRATVKEGQNELPPFQLQ